jgi:acyl-CoA thioesterase I
MKKIFFFGDSICIGQYISIHKSWVARLSKKLHKLAVVLNSSVNGRTTRQALEDMPYHIQEQHPDILVVQFGLNDCNYWESDKGLPRVSMNAFDANLREIIDRAIRFGVKKIFLNTNHPTLLDANYRRNSEKYNNVIRNIVSTNKDMVKLNDIEYGFIDSSIDLEILLLPDRLHPSEIGHKLYYKIVYKPIRDAVKEISK